MRQAGQQPEIKHPAGRGVQVALALLLASFSTAIADPTITTVAGGGPHGVPALATNIEVSGIAVDGAGVLHFLSPDERVYRVDPSGLLWQVAGTGINRHLGDGSPASRASFYLPESFASGPDGDLFVHQGSVWTLSPVPFPVLGGVDRRIRRIDAATGLIETVQGTPGVGADPATLAISPTGDIYVSSWTYGGSDGWEQKGFIHRLDPLTGFRTHLAGNGSDQGGPVDDGLPGTEVSLKCVPKVALSPTGSLFIADGEHQRIRILDPQTGLIDTYAGNGLQGSTGDGGPALDASVIPGHLATDPLGNLHVSEGGRIRRIDAVTGIITTVAGTGTAGFSGDGGQAAQANIAAYYIAFDLAGNLYLASSDRIRRIDAVTGIIQTVAGDPTASFPGDGGPAGQARLTLPADVVVSPEGDLFIAEARRIRKVDGATGAIATIFTEPGGGTTIWGLALHPDGSLYRLGSGFITDFTGPQGVFDVRRIDLATLQSTVVTGQPFPGSFGDGGPAHLAAIGEARDIAIDASGNLYIADTANRTIRRVDAMTNVITTFAGWWAPPGSPLGDGGPATEASLGSPQGVDVDDDGNVFIADSGRIRRVDVLTGIITTVAGNGTSGSSGDGLPATAASIVTRSVLVDDEGNLYISGDQRVRRVAAATGIITTIAGNGSFDSQGDGGHPLLAAIAEPLGMALDAAGDLHIAANGEGRVRKVTQPPQDLMVMLSPAHLWSPNHRLVDVHATVIPTGGFVPVHVVLESIGSSEPDDAAGNADGRTVGDVRDADTGTADFDFHLRAERNDASQGRLYTVTYAATDAGSNVVRGTGYIAVPHNRDGLSDSIVLRTGGPGIYVWGSVPSATSYDVIRGLVANLDETPDENLLGAVDCLANNLPPPMAPHLPQFTDPTVPPLGSIFFYLVGYDHPDGYSGFGTEGAGKPRQITSGGCP